MKILILSSSQNPGSDPASERLNLMAGIVGKFENAGIYRNIQKASQLQPLLESEKPDLVFCASYFVYDDATGEKANIHRILDQLNIPFVGSDADTLELVLSKAALKKRGNKTDQHPQIQSITKKDYLQKELA